MERYERMKFSATSPEIDFLDEVAASIKGKMALPRVSHPQLCRVSAIANNAK